MSEGRIVRMTYCLNDVLSEGCVVRRTYCQDDILSEGHIVYWTLCQYNILDILSIGHTGLYDTMTLGITRHMVTMTHRHYVTWTLLRHYARDHGMNSLSFLFTTYPPIVTFWLSFITDIPYKTLQ